MAKQYHNDVYDKGLEQISNSANWGGGVMSMVMCMAKPANAAEASTLYPAGKRVSGAVVMAGGDFTLQNKSGGGREVAVGAKSDTAGVTVTQADSGTATSGTTTALNDTAKAWTVDEHIGWACEITGGTGSGQKFIIASNTATQLVPEVALTTAPDATSTYKIVPDLCVVLYDGGTSRVLSVVNESNDGDIANGSTLNFPAHTLGITAPQ